MSIQGSSNIPHQPNLSLSNEQQPINGGNPQLAKKVLESNAPTTSTPLQSKKVTKTEHEQNVSSTTDFIPSSLNVLNSKQFFDQLNTSITQSKSKIEEIEEEARLKKSRGHRLNENILHRANYTAKILAKAKIYQIRDRESEAQQCIEFARSQVTETTKLSYFNCGTQYAAYLFKTYNGITCLDMNVIRDSLLTLRRAVALNPESKLFTAELDKATEFFEARWKELKDEGKLSEEDFKVFGQQLKQVLTEDPFREEFIKNPELFKKVKDAPAILLQQYPHLASINDFLSRYPDAGTIYLRNGTYNLQNLKLTLADAEASPLTQNINLLVDEPVITSTAAKLIRDFMLKHPKVKVYLSDEADGAELARSFLEDSTLMANKGALVCAKGVVTGRSELVYSYMIDPEDPFVKKKPESWLSSSHVNTTLSVEENFISKITLENNSSSSSPSITEKVSKTDFHKKTDNPNTYFSSRLPYFPPNSKPLQNIIEKVTSSRKHYLAEIEKTPQDMAPRTQFTIHTLALARICHQTKQLEEEEKLISSVQSAVDSFLLFKYFQAGTHLSKYLLDGYHGITCLDMNVIRDNLLTLRRAIVLSANNDAEYQKLITDLDKAAEFFETRWKELKDEGKLSEEDFKILGQQLKQILTEDPFKDEFINNPELFKKIKDAPPILLQKYPHLASVNDFLSRYPDAGTINLPDNVYNTKNLNICINQARTSPLSRLLILVSPESLLTPAEARNLKDLLVEKQNLGIVFGNEDDLTTLTDAFIKDSNLILNEKSLLGAPKYLDSLGEVFFFGINPEYPIKKKVQPQLKVKKTDSSLQGTTELIDGHVFFVLNRESGKKALAVRDYEVEAIKKIKNRTYIDENGIKQEYDIVVFGPEYYEKLDAIEKMIKDKYSPNIESMLQKHSSKK